MIVGVTDGCQPVDSAAFVGAASFTSYGRFPRLERRAYSDRSPVRVRQGASRPDAELTAHARACHCLTRRDTSWVSARGVSRRHAPRAGRGR